MDARFQVCFTPLAAVLFAFPSRYLFAIGHRLVFSLGGWSPRIRTEFHVLRPTRDPGRTAPDFGYGALTPCGPAFQPVPLSFAVPRPGPATPECKHSGLASCAFARHYSRNRVCFPFLRVLRCFTSPGVALGGLLNSSASAMALAMAGCPIRRPPDQSPLTAPRRLSQSAASFIAS